MSEHSQIFLFVCLSRFPFCIPGCSFPPMPCAQNGLGLWGSMSWKVTCGEAQVPTTGKPRCVKLWNCAQGKHATLVMMKEDCPSRLNKHLTS